MKLLFILGVVCCIVIGPLLLIAAAGETIMDSTDEAKAAAQIWTSLSIATFIIGIGFLIWGLVIYIMNKPVVSGIIEEPIDYKIVNCPKCGSSSMTEEPISKGKWKRICSKCKVKWIAVKK